MSLRKVIFLISLVLSVGCCAAAFLMAGLWPGALIAVLPGALPLLRRAGRWREHALLWSMSFVAAAGILLGASAWLALAGAAFALAAWDLMNLDHAMAGSEPIRSTRRSEMRHALILGACIGVGLLLAEAGLALSFPIPFPVMCGLVLLDIFCLSRVVRLLQKGSESC